MTAPIMATRTTPPAPMLSKKFFRDGVTPSAASATSGIIINAVSAAAAFFPNEEDALTWSLPLGLVTLLTPLDGFTGSGLNKASELGATLFWLARAEGRTIETAEMDAIDLSL
ncbi:hypothetical protein GQ457_11G017240 [Hibiscus cannabinus]